MIKVAIIGCGKIADEHATAIKAVEGTEIVGVCDRDELMAGQLAERTGSAPFQDAASLLKRVGPQVVHITTPPQSHFKLGKLCLDAGCHLVIEKPFTVSSDEATELIGVAERKGLKITVGHNHQFSPAAQRMRELIAAGFLGGDPVHMESLFCYDMSDGYARALLGDTGHWVRALPGQLLHNVISHGICKIAEFLRDENISVVAHGFKSPTLQRAGDSDLVDELRVIISESNGATAYFTFSTQIKPGKHEFKIFGPKNFLSVDHTHQTLVRGCAKSYKIQLNFLLPPWIYAKEYWRNTRANVSRFLRNDFHMDAGRRALLKAFYGCVRDGNPVPIPYREIILTARIMDAIFAQLSEQAVLERAKDLDLPACRLP